MTCDGNITLDCITKAGSFMTCDGNVCIRTSLPPEAPDACAHVSVVLILAHLCAVCSRLSEVLALQRRLHDAEVGDQSFKACKVHVKP